ncbi:MAG: AI-2E family transporter [Bradymonadaceae bacterium]
MKAVPEDQPEGASSSEATEIDALGHRLDFFQEIHAMRVAIFIIAAGVALAILNFASPILIPIILAVFLSYVLTPFVNTLMRLRIPGTQIHLPRSLASLIVVLSMVALTAVIGMFIGDQVRRLALELPLYEDRISENIGNLRDGVMNVQQRFEGMLEPIRREADEGTVMDPIDGAAQEERVQVFLESSGNDFWPAASAFIAGGITGFLGFLAQALMCIFVLVFILAQAPNFRVKIINILGNDVAQRQLVLNVLQNVNADIQRYLFNRFATNTVVAIAVGLSFYIYGLKFAFLLGILAGIFNFIPYVGPIIGTFFPAIIAYMQFGDIKSVVIAVLIYGCITGIEGNLITPVIIGRHLKLNSLAVLLSLIFWGWLWGAIGLLLAIPVIAALKAVSEHVDGLKPLNELLRG